MKRITKEWIDDMLELQRDQFAEKPVEILPGSRLAGGTMDFGLPCSEKPWWLPGSRQEKPENAERPDFRSFWRDEKGRYPGFDNVHFPVNYRFVMDHGVGGIARMCREPIEDYRESMNETDRMADAVYAPTLEERELYRGAIAEMYGEIIPGFILKHASLARSLAADAAAVGDEAEVRRLTEIAACCEAIGTGDGVPRTFRQGVQLFWFMWRIRNPMTSPIGRLDVTLKKLYEEDVLAGKSSREDAFDLLCELWEFLNRQNSGDTLMNLMLGGVDADGNDVSSDLSVLMMEVTMKVAKSEPHVNVRIHDGTADFFKKKAAEMIAMGQGQGVVYGDNLIIPQLVSHGVPLEIARNYANDGCTEVTLDGEAAIHFLPVEAMKSVELMLFNGRENPSKVVKNVVKGNRWNRNFLYSMAGVPDFESGDIRDAQTFDEIMDAYKRQYKAQLDYDYDLILREVHLRHDDASLVTKFVLGGLCERSVRYGIDPLRGGYRGKNYQILAGSLPTVADSLYAIREVVFERKLCTMRELIDMLSVNFEGHEEFRQMLVNLPKFGNNDDGPDKIAAELAEFFCDTVDAYEVPYGIRIWPGVYNIDFIQMASNVGATPDGRLSGDPISCHYSPTPGCAKKGPTAALLSASKADLSRGYASSPVYLSLPQSKGGISPENVWDLTETALELGVPVLSLTFYDREILEDARLHPEKHEDLIVRVWGYNARYVDLCDDLQEHIMGRLI